MEQGAQKQSGQNGVMHRQMDFVANKTNKTTKVETSEKSSPAPVTSAKDAINAMYAEQAQKMEPILAPSAREAVNAAASQDTGRNSKSAANLHHGSIQKNIDTSRTSAAALLQRAKSPRPSATETEPANSFDPLASRLPKAAHKKSTQSAHSEQEIPVIRTSLKLGSSARPKSAPVVLPPNARMAQVARPVGGSARISKLSGLLSRRPGDAQIIQPNTINPGQHTKHLASGAKSLPSTTDNNGALEVQILSGSKALPTKAPAQMVKSAPKPITPARVPRPTGPLRDPQMVGGGNGGSHRTSKSKAAPLWPAAAATALGPKPKFRSAPKGYASAAPTGVATDNAYVMATPPKINLARHRADLAELGVVEDYHASRVPEPMGDKAPIGRLKAQTVAVGHGKAAPSIKADNTSNYSFLSKKKPVDNNRYALGGQSPFLKSVNVEKRPLSDNAAHGQTKIERPMVEEKSGKSGRKNIYAKKNKSKTDARQDLPQRPTVIVPASRRSKVPLFFLILFTIILGAVVGAAAYLCFFQ